MSVTTRLALRSRAALVVAVMMAAAGLTALSSSPATSAAGRPGITASPAHPLQGTSVALRTKFASRGKRPVALHRYVDGRWKVQARKRTRADGRVGFKVTAIGVTKWRIRAKAARVGGRRLQQVTSRTFTLRPVLRTELVSATPAGVSPNAESAIASISADGRYVAFHSAATTLVPGVTGYAPDSINVFLRDRSTGTTTLVSATGAGAPGNGDSIRPAISEDGRYVTFLSYANNLVAGDNLDQQDVFRWSRATGTIIKVTAAADGAGTNADSYDPVISANGDRIAYSSTATNIDAGDTNGASDVFVWDANTGESARVSLGSNGQEGNDDSLGPTISADGAYVSFGSRASNLILNDDNGAADIFRKAVDSPTGITLVSRGATTQSSDAYSSLASAISSTGRYVAFASAADNLVAGGTPDNGSTNVFLRDITAGTTRLISKDRVSGPTDGSSFPPGSVSADGSLVTFPSDATDLVAGDTNGVADAFLWQRSDDRVVRVVRDKLWGQVNGPVYEPRLSANGKWVAFYSAASDLSPRDTTTTLDVFVWRR